jgi:hypothetical protein
MSGLVKLACPGCGCVVFEPQSHLDTLDQKYSCIPCSHIAPIAAWKVAGIASKKRPDLRVRLAVAASRSRRLAADLRTRAQAIIHSYGGGISA